MEDCGLLDPWSILSHANSLSEEDIDLVKRRNAHISSTPSVELQMGMGTPACFDADRDIQSHSSLGIDCHNATLASLPAEMRMALQNSRGVHNEKFIRKGLKPAKIYKTVQDVYALGTIAGARAIGMSDKIGSIAEGKLADLIVFDALTPNMICGAQQDPITTIVMHSTPADIVLTIVDGIIRKKDGQLKPVHPEGASDSLFPISSPSLQWREVAERLLETRATLNAKIDQIDLVEAKNGALKAFGYDPSKIVDSV
jgi:cytosine/adenosine deaminase-related metal-dependent hydrolase